MRLTEAHIPVQGCTMGAADCAQWLLVGVTGACRLVSCCQQCAPLSSATCEYLPSSRRDHQLMRRVCLLAVVYVFAPGVDACTTAASRCTSVETSGTFDGDTL